MLLLHRPLPICRQRRLTKVLVDDLVRHCTAGADMREMAEVFGAHRTTVAGHLRRAWAELRRQGLPDEQATETGRLYGSGWASTGPASGWDVTRKRWGWA